MYRENFISKVLIEEMLQNERTANAHPLVQPDMTAIGVGINFSKRLCAQHEEVVMTPWMKNLAEKLGDIHQEGNKLTKLDIYSSEESKCKKWVMDYCARCLSKFDGQERHEYNEKLLVDDPDHYHVDNWIAYSSYEDKFWDIKAGQAKQREEAFSSYEQPTKLTTSTMIKMINQSSEMRKAVDWMFKRMPDVTCNKTLVNVEDTFMNKDSNVTYPWFRNDRSEFKSGKEMKETYGKMALDFTKTLVGDLTPKTVWNVWKFNVYTGLPRNQRGSGRALEAQSRVMNIVNYSMNGPEMEKVKGLFEFTGLNDDKVLKANFAKMRDFCNTHPDYACGNWDQSKFDRHIGIGLINVIQSLRCMHAMGSTSKEVCRMRFAHLRTGWFINGPASKLTKLYGRTPSGDNDTTLNNTHINWFVDLTSNLRIDAEYSKNVLYSNAVYGMYLGDDDCSIHKRSPIAKQSYVDTCKTLGLEVNKEKYAYGCFFLQYRFFRDPKSGEDVMTYPWPRVLRSMLSKETTKGLGPVGWTIAAYQQLSKLIECKYALKIVANLIYVLDEHHLFLDKSVDWIKSQLQKEDQEALEKNKNARTTAERLYDGNPQDKMFDSQSNMKSDYLTELQSAIRDAIEPHWFESLGIKQP